MDASTIDRKYLFGGDAPWPTNPSTANAQCPVFRAVDDRVRGGSSTSHLTISPSGQTASFNGTLDTSTLGGAGFASQVTLDGPTWDLSSYEGLELVIGTAEAGTFGAKSEERYVLLLKDTLEGDRGDGRQKSGISWEYVFQAGAGQVIKAQWEEFKPTYRGREIEVPEGGLRIAEIKSMGFMMRSFFDAQSGAFNLPIESLAAFGASHNNALATSKTHQSTASSATRVGSHAPTHLEKSEKGQQVVKSPQTEKDEAKARKKAEKAERERERDARTGIGALTGEMRDRGEGGQPGWRGWVNWIGRGCF